MVYRGPLRSFLTKKKMISISNEMYTRKLYLMKRVDKMTKTDTFFEEIRTCDCFLQKTISFMSKLKKLKQIGNSITVWHCDVFEDFMGIHSDNFPRKKKLSW